MLLGLLRFSLCSRSLLRHQYERQGAKPSPASQNFPASPRNGSGSSGLTIPGVPGGQVPWSIIVTLTILTLIPSILLCMTPFARLLIVFHFLRQALGLQTNSIKPDTDWAFPHPYVLSDAAGSDAYLPDGCGSRGAKPDHGNSGSGASGNTHARVHGTLRA